ncbi:MAG: TrkA family potassium uptake protein [Desulfobacterales bacterium]|nr:TrkA family potassium uptake protein [Desulfobacterales bacterium]MCP4163750.1 TrkA family potassium uptake protein [Deltaproteobacteria bacterium]
MKQFAVIGIGNFGYYLARHLYKKGHDVIAIDHSKKLIQKIKDDVTQAVVADATDPEALRALGLDEMDYVVVCIGSILGNSILTTQNLIELGARNIIAKAITEPHGRILERLGVNEIFFPEKDLAISLAEKLNSPNMIDYLPFIEGFSITQLEVEEKLSGKSLKDLNLNNRYGVQVVTIKDSLTSENKIPTGDFILKSKDVMILFGPNDALKKVEKSQI